MEGWKRAAVIEQLRQVVLPAVTLRFGPPPSALAAKSGERTDLDELERRFKALHLAGSLSTFRKLTGL